MQTSLIAFEVVARINRINIDLRAIIREYSITEAELTKEELLRIAKRFEFKAKLKKLSLETISEKYPLPAIFILKNDTYGVVLKINPETQKLLVFVPTQKEPQELSFEEFNEIASGEFIILALKAFNSQVSFGFKWFYHEIVKYKRVILEVLLGSFVVQLFGLVTPLFTQVILDKVIVHRSMTTLNVLGIAFVAVMLFEFLLNITRNYIFIHTANKIDAKLGAKLFKHLFSLPFIYFENRKVGNIISRVRELDNIRDFITNKSVSVIIDMLFSFVFVVVMLLYSLKLTLIVLGFVFTISVLYLIITPELRNRLNYKFMMSAKSNSYLVESVTGVQTVKSLAIEGTMQRKWEDYLGDYLQSSFKLASMGNFTGALSSLFQKAMTISILYIGVNLVIDNRLTIGQLIAFQMFAGQFTGPVLRLVNLWNQFQQTLLAVDRLGDILNHPVEIQSSKAITLPVIKGAIRIENITFKYTLDSPNVLKNVSIDIAPGMSVGLAGKSGSGKSTITKLVQRLYTPHEGAVFIDDIDIRNMNPVWLRNNIGVVLQENYLFSGSIGENIAIARPDAPMEMIIEAAKISGAHDFISLFPEGYDTIVGERGSTLSGGQKQMIGIARALISGPRIIILDEATSSLDYEAERIIQQNLKNIQSGRTMIIIAHRLSMVANCDLIIALDKGRIVETGTHAQLLNNNGYYRYLYDQQEAMRTITAN